MERKNLMSFNGEIKSVDRAELTLRKEISEDSLDGLEGFNYIWIIGYKDTEEQLLRLILAKLEKIEGRTIQFLADEIEEGIKVLDIKPYHYKDALDPSLLNNEINKEENF